MILSHDFQKRFFEGEALGRELEDVDIGANEIAEDFRETIHGMRGELKAIVVNLGGGGPRSQAGKKFLAQIMGANIDVDFAFGRSAEIARADDLALLDEHDGVASDFDFAKQVGVEEDGGAALAFIANDVADKMPTHGIEAGSRLIEEDEFGFVNESLGEADALHHAFGKTVEAAIAMGSEADEIDVGGNTLAELRGSEATEAAVEGKEFGCGEPVVETKVFGKESDLTANFDVGKRMAEDLRFAAGGPDQAEKHLDGSAFASAVGSKEAKNFATTNLERQASDRDFGAELLAEVVGVDGEIVGWQKILRHSVQRVLWPAIGSAEIEQQFLRG